MESDILNANIPEEEKSKLMKNLLNLKKQKINLMITGATGNTKRALLISLGKWCQISALPFTTQERL